MSKHLTLELFSFAESLPVAGSEVLLVNWNDWAQAHFRQDINGVGLFDFEDDDGTTLAVDDPDASLWLWCYVPVLETATDEDGSKNSIEDEVDNSETTTEDEPPLVNDPIISQLQARAADLSLSSLNPEAIARKLREDLASIAGQSAITYHIGGKYDSRTGEVKFQISRLSPDLAIRLSTNLLSSDLSIAYTKQTSSGWTIEVGLIAKHYGPKKASEFLNGLSGTHVEAEFGVTIRK